MVQAKPLLYIIIFMTEFMVHFRVLLITGEMAVLMTVNFHLALEMSEWGWMCNCCLNTFLENIIKYKDQNKTMLWKNKIRYLLGIKLLTSYALQSDVECRLRFSLVYQCRFSVNIFNTIVGFKYVYGFIFYLELSKHIYNLLHQSHCFFTQITPIATVLFNTTETARLILTIQEHTWPEKVHSSLILTHFRRRNVSLQVNCSI